MNGVHHFELFPPPLGVQVSGTSAAFGITSTASLSETAALNIDLQTPGSFHGTVFSASTISGSGSALLLQTGSQNIFQVRQPDTTAP